MAFIFIAGWNLGGEGGGGANNSKAFISLKGQHNFVWEDYTAHRPLFVGACFSIHHQTFLLQVYFCGEHNPSAVCATSHGAYSMLRGK